MKLMKGTQAIFCIGSNCGNREGNVRSAIEWLSGLLMDFRHSDVYSTPDFHGGQRVYMNCICLGLTDLSPANLNALCKDYEVRCGRDSVARSVGNVPVDIDLVVYDREILREKDFRCEFFKKGYRHLLESGAVR
ncbi:MAG: 2-amino-4-hydroxy-6-hydroxymethyldihydropteridine diphosphokinase [Muribaculaceae bacterium]|nr:2-amino-4-hydroxy-6-hydroxymethyldihydropteridine diphosphokinase [Muribaculaceae bacterium]